MSIYTLWICNGNGDDTCNGKGTGNGNSNGKSNGNGECNGECNGNSTCNQGTRSVVLSRYRYFRLLCDSVSIDTNISRSGYRSISIKRYPTETGIDNTLLAQAGIDNTLLAQAGIDNPLLAQAGIDNTLRYRYLSVQKWVRAQIWSLQGNLIPGAVFERKPMNFCRKYSIFCPLSFTCRWLLTKIPLTVCVLAGKTVSRCGRLHYINRYRWYATVRTSIDNTLLAEAGIDQYNTVDISIPSDDRYYRK